MSTNDQQRRALAYLTKTYRASVYGAGEWDEPGIMAALVKVQHIDLGMQTMAAMRAAADPSVKTPAMIGDPSSSVYVERVGPVTARRHATPATACPTCGYPVDSVRPDCAHPSSRPTPRDPAASVAGALLARALLHGQEAGA